MSAALFPLLANDWADNLTAAVSLLLAAFWLVRLLRPADLKETLLFAFPVSAALVAVWAYLLSFWNRLADLSAWAALGAATAALAGGLVLRLKPPRLTLLPQAVQSVGSWAAWLAGLRRDQKAIILPMIFAAFFTAGFNLLLVLFTVPHTWDALTYHLPRMAYYLQQGNFSFLEANYWAQAIHPKNSVALLIYLFLVGGRGDNLTQLVEYVSHGVLVLSIYAVSLQAGLSKTQSAFSALTGALLVSGAVLAVSAQNDLLIAACFGAATYSVMAYRRIPRRAYLFIAALALALTLGMKASSALALPSFGLVALYALTSQTDKKRALANLLLLGAFTLTAGIFLVLPAGYAENYKRFGSLVGPLKVRQMHSFEGQDAAYILKAGGYNLLRFAFDFLAFDGLPPSPPVRQAERLLRLPLRALTFPLNLESDFAEGFSPFLYENDRAVSWGVLGFGLMWGAAALAALRRAGNRDLFVLALAAFAFLLAQAFSGPYDSARGRYFMTCAVFAAPAAGWWISTNAKALRLYLALIALAASVSAVSAVYGQRALLTMNRDEQFSSKQPAYAAKLRAFDFLVPQDAVVALYLPPNTFEYPLFGRGLTRVLTPINSFVQGLQPIPPAAQYLLYAKGYPCPLPGDRHLKGDWFLRKLNDSNRACKFP